MSDPRLGRIEVPLALVEPLTQMRDVLVRLAAAKSEQEIEDATDLALAILSETVSKGKPTLSLDEVIQRLGLEGRV